MATTISAARRQRDQRPFPLWRAQPAMAGLTGGPLPAIPGLRRTGRGRPYLRGAITGAGTFPGGIVHTLPFLLPRYRPAVLVALAVTAFGLLALA